MMTSPLRIVAGADALAEIRDHGLRPSEVEVLVGASGGPKWLALHGMDRVLFPRLMSGRTRRLHALCSSIGAWRFVALSDSDPAAAVARFAEVYLSQHYEDTTSPPQVRDEFERLLDLLLAGAGEGRAAVAAGAERVATHGLVKLHIVTVRAKNLSALEGRGQALGLGLGYLLNAIDRRALGAVLERVVFDAEGSGAPFAPWSDLPTRHVALTPANTRAALLATASIPMLVPGVVDPPGAPPGVYRDGGVSDYHFSDDADPAEGIALYPHFYPSLTPGWFDKKLRRRTKLARTVVIAPSPEFVAGLPGGKIPDRYDFDRMDDVSRLKAWRTMLFEGERLGDALAELLEDEGAGLARVAQPF